MPVGLSPGGENLIAEAVCMASLKEGDTLLDIGCGRGDTIAILAKEYGLVCYGIDRETEWDGSPSRNPQYYDAVLFECVLSTLDDIAASVRVASQLLNDGGRLIIADLCGRKGLTPAGAIDASALEAACRLSGLVPAGWQDRTADLDAFAAEVLLSYGSFEAYLGSVCNASESPDAEAPIPLRAFCRLDPKGPPPGYFLAVYVKGAV